MKIGYLAITDICNYKCRNCPYKMRDKKIIPYEDIKKYIDESDNIIQGVVLSGGEPTLHPDFIKILSYLNKKGKYITILSNGSRLASQDFINNVKSNVDLNKLNVVMTLYSINEKKHDKGTGINGSYKNTLKALKMLYENQIKVILKHCISNENYKELPRFFKYIDKKIPSDISLQLTTLDFSGMNEKLKKENYFTYSMSKKYINKALKRFDNKRNINIVNTPFCAMDSQYWKYVVKKQKKAYEGYKSIKTQATNVGYDCGCLSELCRKCKMLEECPGVYKANYEFIGDNLVNPISVEEM